MASQSRCSVPAVSVSGSTRTARSEDAIQRVEIQQLVVAGHVVGSRSAEVVTIALGENDVPLGALSWSLPVKSGRMKDLLRLSRKGRPNPVPASGRDEGGWVFTEEKLQHVPWAKLFATGLKNPVENRQKFYCLIGRFMCLCGHVDYMRSSYIIKVGVVFKKIGVIANAKSRGLQGKEESFISYRFRLVEERKVYMDFKVLEMGHKRLFYYDVFEAKCFLLTSEHHRVSI